MSEGWVLLDTSAWIAFFGRRGFPALKEAVVGLLEEHRAAITGPVIVELIQGCRTESEKETVLACLTGLHHLSVADADWGRAADLAFRLRRRGVTVSAIDAVIATVAMTHSCRLLHLDQDYEQIAAVVPELRLYRLDSPRSSA